MFLNNFLKTSCHAIRPVLLRQRRGLLEHSKNGVIYSAFNRRHVRGSAYVLVIGIAMVVTVLGMAAMTLSRVSAKSVGNGNDWEAAGDLAFAATEHAMSYLNAAAAASPAGWRSSYTSGQTAFTQAMGRGTFSWAIKDEVDGNLSADYLDAFRLYGIGKVGSVTRVYSVQVIPGGSALDVLRTALHSSGAITLTANTQAVNGPISSNANVSLSGSVSGTIEAASTSGNSSSNPTIIAPSAAKTMPSTSVFSDLLPQATVLNTTTLQNCLLSPTSNPYGSLNASGLYSIAVTGNNTITIKNCRIVGTLLISFSNKGTLQLQGPVEWEPASSSFPILVVSGSKTNVVIGGSNTWLSESSVGANLNPAGAPFQGSSNTTSTDDYPPQYRGVMHLMCGSGGTVQINANAYINGTVIADCPVQTSAQTTLIQDPSIYANPPFGYATGNALAEVPGTWRWDTLP